jgi:hypothetical protein
MGDRRTRPSAGPGWTSAASFEELRSIASEPSWEIARELAAELAEQQHLLSVEVAALAPSPGELPGCEDAARLLATFLKRRGYQASVLSGELVVGQSAWLEHAVCLVRLDRYRIALDITAAQFEDYATVELLAVLAQDHSALGLALAALYDWWLPRNP